MIPPAKLHGICMCLAVNSCNAPGRPAHTEPDEDFTHNRLGPGYAPPDNPDGLRVFSMRGPEWASVAEDGRGKLVLRPGQLASTPPDAHRCGDRGTKAVQQSAPTERHARSLYNPHAHAHPNGTATSVEE